MNKVIVTEQYLYDIGNAIREKTGASSTYTPSQMASAIESIETSSVIMSAKTIYENGTYNPQDDGVDGYSSIVVDVADSGGGDDAFYIAMGVASGSIKDHQLTSIKSLTFTETYITGIEATSVISIGASAFKSCFYLSSISFPNCTFIMSDAFYKCQSLSNVYIPECTVIESGAFQNTGIISLNLPKCSDICPCCTCLDEIAIEKFGNKKEEFKIDQENLKNLEEECKKKF
jgi:hypothetical protein